MLKYLSRISKTMQTAEVGIPKYNCRQRGYHLAQHKCGEIATMLIPRKRLDFYRNIDAVVKLDII